MPTLTPRTSASILSVCALLLQLACRGDSPARDAPDVTATAPAPTKVQIPVPAFSGDSAYAAVERQLAFGPRVPGSEAHAQTVAYIRRALERYGATVEVQEFPAKFFDGKRATGRNIVGSFSPEATRRVFVSAHYDTRPFADSKLADPARRDEPIPGADDGASGVATLLELGRAIGANPPGELGVDLVFFDLEDYGKPGGETEADMYTWGLGSQAWAANPVPAGYGPEWGILLDMVGAEGAVFGKEGYSRKFAGDVQQRIWALARRMGKGERFVNDNIGYATDDHFFVNTIAGFPTVDIIYRPLGGELAFGEHWHTHDDDLPVIDRSTLGDVGQVVLAAIYREAGYML